MCLRGMGKVCPCDEREVDICASVKNVSRVRFEIIVHKKVGRLHRSGRRDSSGGMTRC